MNLADKKKMGEIMRNKGEIRQKEWKMYYVQWLPHHPTGRS